MVFPVLQWRTLAVFQKQAIEIRHVVEAGVETDFGDRFIRIQQQFAGKTHPNVDQELFEAVVGMFSKKMTERRITHVHQRGNIRYLEQVIGKVFQNIGISNLNTATVGF